MRQYLYIHQLAELTPWSPAAIRTMMARGTLKPGVHFFRPHGSGSRPIFSWPAVQDYIEGRAVDGSNENRIELADGRMIRVDEAAKEIQRLLG